MSLKILLVVCVDNFHLGIDLCKILQNESNENDIKLYVDGKGYGRDMPVLLDEVIKLKEYCKGRRIIALLPIRQKGAFETLIKEGEGVMI